MHRRSISPEKSMQSCLSISPKKQSQMGSTLFSLSPTWKKNPPPKILKESYREQWRQIKGLSFKSSTSKSPKRNEGRNFIRFGKG